MSFVRLVAVVAVSVAAVDAATGNARAGGAGYARYFDSFKGNTIR